MLSTGLLGEEYWENLNGTISVKDGKATLTYADGVTIEGHFDIIPGMAFSIVQDNGERITFNYCKEDLSDEVIGMWVCNDAWENLRIHSFNDNGSASFTGWNPVLEEYSVLEDSEHFHRTKQAYNVTNIISRWAPPNENDTQTYIRNVLKLTGLGGKENLPQPSRGVDVPRLERLVAAMTTMECAIPYDEVDREAIRQGFDLAFPGKRSLARTQPAPDTFSLDTLEDLLMWDEYRDW